MKNLLKMSDLSPAELTHIRKLCQFLHGKLCN